MSDKKENRKRDRKAREVAYKHYSSFLSGKEKMKMDKSKQLYHLGIAAVVMSIPMSCGHTPPSHQATRKW